MPSKYVIHAVGPTWNNGRNNEEELLSLAYFNSLKLALDNKIQTIAFPNISTGIYRFPKRNAAYIAIKTVREFLASTQEIKKVIFVCFDIENYHIYKEILNT